MYKIFFEYLFQVFRVYFKEWVSGSYNISIISFLMNQQNVFHNSCTMEQSHQQIEDFSFPISSATLIIFHVLNMVILVNVKLYFIVGFIWIFLRANDI